MSCGWKPCDSYRFQPNANIGVRAYRRICRAPFGWLFEKLLSDGLTIGSARPPALLNLNPKVLAMPRACNKQNSDRVPGCCYLTDGLGDTGIPASRKRSFPEAPPLGWPSSFHSNPSVRTVIVCHTSSCYFACYIWGLQETLAYLPARTSNMRILTPIGKRRT